jgi:hypothetical protein
MSRSEKRRTTRRRRFESDEWLIPTDYIATVYGEGAALDHIDELEIDDPAVKEMMIDRARRIGEIGLSPGKMRRP